MPRSMGQFDPAVGIAYAVLVLPPTRYTCEAILEVIKQTGVPPSPPAAMQCTGILDTGTPQTGLTPQVIQELNLSPTGKVRHLGGATGAGTALVYFVDLLLSFPDGVVFIPQLPVLGLLGKQENYDPFQVLIGLDILCKGTFTMSGDGHFTFEIP